MSANIITKENFQTQVMESDKPVLLDFWASWCGPCRMMAPIVEALADEMPDVVFAKVNVDENPDVAMDLGIQAIPTLILYKDGETVERVVGVSAKDALKQIIEKAR